LPTSQTERRRPCAPPVQTEVNKPLQILDLEQEGPKAGEVRVQVKAAGVCMSDWHIMNGDWPLPLPMVLGHEAAGIVAELGPGVTNVRKGDHVIFSFRPHCGHCSYCSRGPHRAVHRPQRHPALAHARRHGAREAQRRAGQSDGAHRHVF
jgi:Zn-dependent alcohol dehydrogenase